MTGEWKECKLGDIVSSNKESIGKNYPFQTILYLDTGSITRGKIDSFQEYELSKAPSRAKRLVKNNVIVYSTVRPIQRHYGFIVNPQENLVVSTGFAVIEVKEHLAAPLFIFYFLTSDEIVETLDVIAEASTSAYPSLKSSDIEALDLLLPPLPEQHAIASVLSSLDDKIDLLHRQNKTLEAMAETLFRQWFVEGADEEWEKSVLGDVISVKGGTTPSTKEPAYWDGDIYWTSPRDLSDHNSVFLFDTQRKITENGLAKIGSGLLPIGTVLLSSRAPIGYLAITEIPLAINQGYIAIVCDKVVSNYFVFLWCKVNMEKIKNSGNGSVFQEIAKSVFKELSVTIPPLSLLDDFEQTVNPLFEKIKTNQQQIRTLEKLRDTLLPKLMSGEVRVELAQGE
ncbi:MAG: type restriction enzyme subunit [Methanolobus sp.]|uniref:restriction endonuclease subunit S n=1 Tax=Methanolobus sp. TaxID=1874737 RepID=UPI0025856B6C|nr:restriction endonuclease subunit S [Methanolobus sp.]MDK2831664.1 type restriction enzyme subunit [Methanolobus sp.]